MKTQNHFNFQKRTPYILKDDSTYYPNPAIHPVALAKQRAAIARARTEAIAHKLTYENQAFLLQKAEILGVSVVHIFDECAPKGGMTVAFRKVSPFAKGTMVEVAVATCSKEDSFSRKTGTKLALESFFNGEVIQLPLNNPVSKEGISTQVKWAFEGLFYAI